MSVGKFRPSFGSVDDAPAASADTEERVDNRWRHGPVDVVLPPLAPDERRVGAMFAQHTFDSAVGSEVYLAIRVGRQDADDLASDPELRVSLPYAFVRTTTGPVLWALVALGEGAELVMELFLNPLAPHIRAILRQAARQQWLKVLVYDIESQETAIFCDIGNVFGLEAAADVATRLEFDPAAFDFAAAQEWVMTHCSPDWLLGTDQSM